MGRIWGAKMMRREIATFCSGHLKPAPLLEVSGKAVLPDTYRTPRKPRLGAGFEARCPGVRQILTCARIRPPARARLRACTCVLIFNGHTGHPDTSSNGAGLRCPVGVRKKKEPDTLMECTTKTVEDFRLALRETGLHEFARALHEAGLIDGLRGARLGVLPEGLPVDSRAVVPVMSAEAEKKALDAAWAKGGRCR